MPLELLTDIAQAVGQRRADDPGGARHGEEKAEVRRESRRLVGDDDPQPGELPVDDRRRGGGRDGGGRELLGPRPRPKTKRGKKSK